MDFFREIWTNLQFPVDLITFNTNILHRKLRFCRVSIIFMINIYHKCWKSSNVLLLFIQQTWEITASSNSLLIMLIKVWTKILESASGVIGSTCNLSDNSFLWNDWLTKSESFQDVPTAANLYNTPRITYSEPKFRLRAKIIITTSCLIKWSLQDIFFKRIVSLKVQN